MDQLTYMTAPASLLLGVQSTQHIEKGAVEPLRLRIPLWVERGGSRLLDPTYLTQLFDQSTLKISSLVSMDASWQSVVYKEFFPQCFCDSDCPLVFSAVGLCIAGEMISDY
ncbi:hypothetical protein GDO81_022766 [Engystomops pustulosus]|uniref:Uncharacterized protein n=1 Tax=Engystomops pustulosus TaxID=76066 RepID=A0AAV6YN58_ENGPU|nr:hypothetical protein GDO81_022766 [Engystomops pustulosus]